MTEPLLHLIILLRWGIKGAYADGLLSEQELEIGLACTDALDFLLNDEWELVAADLSTDPLEELERLLRALREG